MTSGAGGSITGLGGSGIEGGTTSCSGVLTAGCGGCTGGSEMDGATGSAAGGCIGFFMIMMFWHL
jgi:hypothetical protein